METEDHDIDVEPIREVFRKVQVVRLHQPETEKRIGVARREEDRSLYAFGAWKRAS